MVFLDDVELKLYFVN